MSLLFLKYEMRNSLLPQLKKINFYKPKYGYLIHSLLDKAFNGTVVIWTCQIIKITVPRVSPVS